MPASRKRRFKLRLGFPALAFLAFSASLPGRADEPVLVPEQSLDKSSQPSSAEVSQAPNQAAPEVAAPRKSPLRADVVRQTAPVPVIAGLALLDAQVPVTWVPNSGKLRPFVEIHGRFDRPGWVLFAQSTPVPTRAKPDFVIYAYLKSEINEITLSARGPHGEVQSEKILVLTPQAKEYQVGAPWGDLLVGLGFSNLTYKQSGYGTFVSKTGLLSLEYTTPKWSSPLGLLAAANLTMFTFSASPTDNGPQIMEAKFDGTYHLTANPDERFQNKLVLGVSYLTMVSNGSPFGFANLFTPELGLRTRYTLNARTALLSDLRYAPAGNNLNLNQRGINIGMDVARTLINQHQVQLGLHYMNYAYEPQSTATVNTSLFSLRLAYGL